MPDENAPKATAGTAASPETYSQAVDSAELRNIRLLKSSFAMEPEGLSINRTNWRLAYRCEVVTVSFDAERKVVSGLVDAEASWKAGRKRLFFVKASYVVAYDLRGTPGEEAATRFVRRVGRFAVYPYFRAHFSGLTAQAGVNIPPLPVMKEGSWPIKKTVDASRAE